MSQRLHELMLPLLVVTGSLALIAASWGISSLLLGPTPATDVIVAPPPGETANADVERIDPPPHMGFAINAHHISDLDLYLKSIDRIAAIGSNTLLLITPMFQQDVRANAIEYLPDRCPTDDQLRAILKRAKAHGLSTILVPIVLLVEAGDKDWRGVIEPDSWPVWWTSYRQFIDRYLSIANDCNVDIFVVGSELNSTEHQEHRWKELINDVRARYSGTIAYASNWDRYDKAELWPLVDVMAVSAYFEIGKDDPDGPPEELAKVWAKHRDDLLAFARAQNKPLLLSEVGYPSLPWAARYPWDYVDDGEKADHKTQARCWESFFNAWLGDFTKANTPAAGFICYAWDPYHHGQKHDTGYGVLGKPAFDTIKSAFETIAQNVKTMRESENEPRP